MRSTFIKVLGGALLLQTVGCFPYNMSDARSWVPVVASQLDSTVRGVSSRVGRANDAEEDWSYYAPRPSYYPPVLEDVGGKRSKQRERKYDQDIFSVSNHQDYEYQTQCKEVQSSEDSLTQIANGVVKITKILFGVSVMIMLPFVLAKMLILPLKLFVVLKLLLKLALLWPLINRVILGGGMIPGPTVLAKLADPAALDAAREFAESVQLAFDDGNSTRSARSFDFMNVTDGTSYCDRRVVCFLSKAITSKNYGPKLALSAAVMFDDSLSGLHGFVHKMKDESEFGECAAIKCDGNIPTPDSGLL